MKTSELIKILKQAGCRIIHEGSNHEIWYSPATGKQFPLGRHSREVATGTVHSILKKAGLK